MWSLLKTLPSTVWLIGGVSFCNDAASEMLYPLLPLYLSSVLMAGPRVLGLIEGIAEATASLLKLFSGVLVDRTRSAKPWIIAGYGLAGLGRPLIAFAQSWAWVLAIRFADRIGKGLRSSPRDALLAASVSPERRGLAFGLHRAMDNGGAVLGPVIAAGLLSTGTPLREIFLWALLPGVITLVMAGALREPAHPPCSSRPAFSWRMDGLPRGFGWYLAAVGLFTLGNSSNLFLLLRARELGMPESRIPLLWMTVSLVAAVFSTHLSALSDRVGRVRFMALGWLAYGGFYGLLGFSPPSGDWLFPLFAAYGLFMAATEGVEKALVADLAPAGMAGTAFGWFNMVTGVMLLPASWVFGGLYQGYSPAWAFGFSAACALGAAVMICVWRLWFRSLAR